MFLLTKKNLEEIKEDIKYAFRNDSVRKNRFPDVLNNINGQKFITSAYKKKNAIIQFLTIKDNEFRCKIEIIKKQPYQLPKMNRFF